jgi:hypothetical protein
MQAAVRTRSAASPSKATSSESDEVFFRGSKNKESPFDSIAEGLSKGGARQVMSLQTGRAAIDESLLQASSAFSPTAL